MKSYNIPQNRAKSHEVPMISSWNHHEIISPRYKSDKSLKFPTDPGCSRRRWSSTNSWRKPCGRSRLLRQKRPRPRLRSLGRRGGWTNGLSVMDIFWRYHGISTFEITFYKWRISIDGWRNWIHVIDMYWDIMVNIHPEISNLLGLPNPKCGCEWDICWINLG